ncbi:MAG: TatD family hydrolase [Gemmatimonadaceae bacterium]|nr:TatD family hydrolase [Gemmatimonadaceae bacterium]
MFRPVPSFIDSHSHLADPKFDHDRDAVVIRAREAGALALVCIGESIPQADRAEAIARAYPGFVVWTAGVHPFDAAAWDAARDVELIRAHVDRGAVAVGECGLDGTYDNSTPSQQRRAFAEQLALAREVNRPIVVHTRNAVPETVAMVREAGQAGVRGILHCFTGPVELAHTAVEAGWYVSFSGVVTFKRWRDDDLVRLVPEDRILVETDAPYLAPEPVRGTRNEPSLIPNTLAHLARARGVTTDALGRSVSRNAIACFGLAVAMS